MKTIKIKGMSCGHCAAAVTKALSAIEGVRNVDVNLEKGEARFEETSPVPADTIKEEIRKAGYQVV